MRVIDVPAGSSLDEVHDVLQVGLGWTDSHLHEFVAGEQRYQPTDDDLDLPDPPPLDERSARIEDLPTRWTYVYDFGDDWTHDVETLGPGRDEPGVSTARARVRPRTAAARRGGSSSEPSSRTPPIRSTSRCDSGRPPGR